jgi:hypothetical protein
MKEKKPLADLREIETLLLLSAQERGIRIKPSLN